MSVLEQSPLSHAMKGASWLGMFKFFSQIISWSGTILITRLLTSEDYGLMEMATVLTGYITLFVEFGVGTALVNRKSISVSEESSAFWCMTIWGLLLSSVCLVVAPLTAEFYHEPRIQPIASAVGIIFILGSLSIVPRARLQRDLRFRDLGIIEVVVTFFSIGISIVLAYMGAGVWTLLGASISREFFSLILYFVFARFKPTLVFVLEETLPLLRFGLPVVLSGSLYYIYTKADRFFGGGSLGAENLGYYAIALQLAAMPVEKIVTLIQGVLYPSLTKVRDNLEEFRIVYLCFISLIALVTFPIYVSGYYLADHFVILVLGEKWAPAIPSFKLLLIGQLFVALTAPNNLIHLARGKPGRNALFNLILAPAMVLSFWYSASFSELDLLGWPWILVYPQFALSYVALTNMEVKIPMKRYALSLKHPIFATTSVAILLYFCKTFYGDIQSLCGLGVLVTFATLLYMVYFITFGRSYSLYMWSLLKGTQYQAYSL